MCRMHNNSELDYRYIINKKRQEFIQWRDRLLMRGKGSGSGTGNACGGGATETGNTCGGGSECGNVEIK